MKIGIDALSRNGDSAKSEVTRFFFMGTVSLLASMAQGARNSE